MELSLNQTGCSKQLNSLNNSSLSSTSTSSSSSSSSSESASVLTPPAVSVSQLQPVTITQLVTRHHHHRRNRRRLNNNNNNRQVEFEHESDDDDDDGVEEHDETLTKHQVFVIPASNAADDYSSKIKRISIFLNVYFGVIKYDMIIF